MVSVYPYCGFNFLFYGIMKRGWEKYQVSIFKDILKILKIFLLQLSFNELRKGFFFEVFLNVDRVVAASKAAFMKFLLCSFIVRVINVNTFFVFVTLCHFLK